MIGLIILLLAIAAFYQEYENTLGSRPSPRCRDDGDDTDAYLAWGNGPPTTTPTPTTPLPVPEWCECRRCSTLPIERRFH